MVLEMKFICTNQNKNLLNASGMQTAEKDTQNNKGGPWEGGFLPFLFAEKGLKM